MCKCGVYPSDVCPSWVHMYREVCGVVAYHQLIDARGGLLCIYIKLHLLAALFSPFNYLFT